MGITFIGPPAEVMRRLGDKIEPRRLTETIGYPLMVASRLRAELRTLAALVERRGG